MHQLIERPKELGPLIARERRRHGITTVQLARSVDVSAQTIRRWEQGDNAPPLDKLQLIAEELERAQQTWTTPATPSPETLGNSQPSKAMIDLKEILRRQSLCKKVAIIKTLLPFKAGWEGYTREQMICALKENEQLEYDFIFPSSRLLFGEKPPSPEDEERPLSSPMHVSLNPPLDSYIKFKQELWTYHDQLANRVRGWRITDAFHALKLQLGAAYGALVVLEYNHDLTMQDEKLRSRSLDLVVECPVAAYESGENFHRREVEESCWLELPAIRRDALWGLLKPQLTNLRKNGKAYLPEKEECLSYCPPAVIPT